MRIIDCDSHFLTCDIYKNISEEFQSLLPKYEFNDNKVIGISYVEDPCQAKDERIILQHCDELGMNNINVRIEDLKKLKIHMQLLSPQDRALRFNYSVEKNLAAEMAHSYNIEIKKIIDQFPDKFFGAAILPLQDMDLALTELHWAIENNFKIVYIDYTIHDYATKSEVPWSTNTRMDEFYKICEKNNVVIYMHFSMQHAIKYLISDRINLIANKALFSSRMEMSIFDLLSDNIFDRYPNLRVVITEGAQLMMGKIIENIAESYKHYPHLYKCKKHPFTYIKENIFFTIDIEMKSSFNLLMEYAGPERLLFSTDYPHDDPSGLNKWKDVDDLYNSGLSQVDLENIAFRNAEKLFGL